MEIATTQYQQRHARYLELVAAVTAANLASHDSTDILAALKAAVRARFRGIATGLLKRTSVHFHTADACPLNDPPARNLEAEHAVPLKLIHNRILGDPTDHDGPLGPLLPADLPAFLEAHIVVVKVTREEHRALTGSTMPAHWEWGGERLARYRPEQICTRCTHLGGPIP